MPCRGADYAVFCIANRDASSVQSFADFFKSSCILPAAEKTRSTPPEDAGRGGAAKYCLVEDGTVPLVFLLPPQEELCTCQTLGLP